MSGSSRHARRLEVSSGRSRAPWAAATLVGFALMLSSAAAQEPAPTSLESSGLGSETPEVFEVATDSFEYSRREVMVPMRDGVSRARMEKAKRENLDDTMQGDFFEYVHKKGLALCLGCASGRNGGRKTPTSAPIGH